MGERKPGGVGTTPRPDVALDIEAELFTQKEVFGGDGDGRAKQKMHELQYVGRQGKGGTNDWEKRCEPEHDCRHALILSKPMTKSTSRRR
ncbi:MAG: hypothetical protein DMG11_30165, partial [Acidobacteria bacterium]